MPKFNHYIGIDYSGAGKHYEPQSNISVAICSNAQEQPFIFASPDKIETIGAWSRKSLAEWLVKVLRNREKVLIGIDHAFSLPVYYLEDKKITNFDMMISHVAEFNPINMSNTVHGSIMCNDEFSQYFDDGLNLKSQAFRITDKQAHQNKFPAKPIFKPAKTGHTVTYATFAGIPWLGYIRENVPKDKLHFWPFDGWGIPEGKSAIVEVYPRLFNGDKSGKKILPPETFGLDNENDRDAYCVAKWMAENDQNGTLDEYLTMKNLSESDRTIADIEGWILGLK